MAGSHVLNALKDKYGRLLGEYETVEQDIEIEEGLQAILAATHVIDAKKAALQNSLDHLTHVIRLWEEDFDPTAVAPIGRYKKNRDKGRISRAAFGVLRDAVRPLKTREISRIIAEQFGEEIDERGMARLDGAIFVALDKRVGHDIYKFGSPNRWSLWPPPEDLD